MSVLVKKYCPRLARGDFVGIINKYFDRHALSSYSQEGEDMILRRLFDGKTVGFYVDVGAHHPKRFSNTYFFYKLGWSGINIDAMPGSMTEFNKLRKRDINLELGVRGDRGCLEYYMFNEPALNSFSKELSEQRHDENSQYRISTTAEVEVRPLAEILDEYLPKDKEIDFLSVDVEGFDLDVLTSNDWDKYRPQYVLAEILGSNFQDLGNDPVVQYIKKQNYKVFCKCMNTVFFESND